MYLDLFTVSLIVVAAITIAAVLTGHALFSVDIHEAERQEKLYQAVKTLRLHEMLDLLGIPIERYISTVPSRKILAHVKSCRACVQISECDRCFRRGIPVEDMSFCPNHNRLLAIKKTLAE
jgi:hypothetical protein